MNTLKIILFAVEALLLISISFQLLRHDAWWIRICDFPHFQLTVLTVLTLLGHGIMLYVWPSAMGLAEYLSLGLLVVILGYQVWIIFPYTPLARRPVKDATAPNAQKQLCILESNVYMYNTDYAAFKALVSGCDPDIIVVLEPNQAWKEALIPLEKNYPHHVLLPQENTYGILLYSRLPLKDTIVRYLIEADVPSIETNVILRDGSPIRFYVVHPKPPAPGHNARSTERDAELIQVGQKVKAQDSSTIVTGDLNDVAWSHSTRLFQRISGLLDPRMGRGFYPTFHANYPLLRWPLDHLFHSDDFLLVGMQRLQRIGSDHFPMCVTLQHHPAVAEQVNEAAEETIDEEDRAEIKRKLEEV